jgi:hypothetical protein
MTHAEKCPVCGGSGKIAPFNDGSSTVIPQPVTCHGCGGLGWVTVGYEPVPYYPIYPIYPLPVRPYPWWNPTITYITKTT